MPDSHDAHLSVNLPRVDVAIVTALQSELDPILDLIGDPMAWKNCPVESASHYVATWSNDTGSVRVVAATAGHQGKDFINAAVDRVIAFRPRLIVMAGCCAGQKARSLLGDLIVSEIAFDPTEGRDTDVGSMSDGEPSHSTSRKPSMWAAEFDRNQAWASTITTPHPELVLARMLCRLTLVDIISSASVSKVQVTEDQLALDWLQQQNLITSKMQMTDEGKAWLESRSQHDGNQLQPLPVIRTPTVHVTPTVQWAAVQARSQAFTVAQAQMRKVLLGDQESLSFLRAAREHDVVALIAKGVVDHADGEKHDIYHRYSKETAARWLHAYLITYADRIRRDLPSTFGPAPPRRDILDESLDLSDDLCVERPALTDQLRRTLLGDSAAIALTAPKAEQAALHGMGGIGETWLARRICADKQIYDHFASGIIWVTVGETPNLRQLLTSLVRRLDHEFSPGATDLSWLRDRLAVLLQDGVYLLILDDIWDYEHLRAIPTGGPYCRRLITTRFADIVEASGAVAVQVDMLAQGQAIELLDRAAKGNLAGVSKELKAEIVARLGYHPLAIRIAGHQLRSDLPEDWLGEFDPTDLDGERPRDIPAGLFAVLQRSLEYLDWDAQSGMLPVAARQSYTDLAILKADERTPAQGIETLWKARHSLSAKQSRCLLHSLRERHLLTLHGEVGQWRVELHDLLRDLVRFELADQVTATHTALLTNYRPASGRWHEAVDDGYLYDHLAYHLAAAERWDELRGLFADDPWLQVRVPQSDWGYDGYLADLKIAWDKARAEATDQIAADAEPAALANCMRYALIRSSVNSLAANYEPALVAEAVRVSLPGWAAQRALSITRKITDPLKQTAMGTALLELRSEAKGISADLAKIRAELQKIALQATQGISNETQRFQTLVALAPQLAGQPKLLSAALQSAHAIPDEGGRSHALAALALQLEGDVRQSALRSALQAAQAIHNEVERSGALRMLALQLEGDVRQSALRSALQATQAINDKESRIEALVALAAQLGGSEQISTIRQMQTDLLARLDRFADSTRGMVLDLCADNRIFAPPSSRLGRSPKWRGRLPPSARSGAGYRIG